MNKEKEILLLSCLRKNGRESLTKMSRVTGMPVSTVFDVMKETDKVAKNTCLLNFTKLGYAIRASIVLKVDSCQKEDIKKFLLLNTNVNSLYKINNGYDFMLEVVYKELKDLEMFIEKLDKFKIIEKNVYYIIDDIAREKFLSDPSLVVI